MVKFNHKPIKKLDIFGALRFSHTSMHTVVDLMAERKDEEVRKRNKEIPSWAPGGADYDPNLPYGPKVYVARRKKPDPWWVTAIEVRMIDVSYGRSVISVILLFSLCHRNDLYSHFLAFNSCSPLIWSASYTV